MLVCETSGAISFVTSATRMYGTENSACARFMRNVSAQNSLELPFFHFLRLEPADATTDIIMRRRFPGAWMR